MLPARGGQRVTIMDHQPYRSLTTASAPANMQSVGPRALSQSSQRPDRASLEPAITEDEFERRIKKYASQSVQHALYPGQNFRMLADYLSRRNGLPSSTSGEPALFATMYLLQASDADGEAQDFISEDFRNFDDLSRTDAHFAQVAKGDRNQILFMRGFPSPKWLCAIGAHFKVDPEYFRSKLDFSGLPYRDWLSPPRQYQNWFSTPSLPSSSNNIIRLRVTILAQRTNYIHDVGVARNNAREQMDEFMSTMAKLQAEVGVSIVRRFSQHDKKWVSLEQDISICCCKRGKGWTVIAWLDSGRDLEIGPSGPWNATLQGNQQEKIDPPALELIPTIRNEPCLDIYSGQSERDRAELVKRAAAFDQKRALLNLDYGRNFEGLNVFDSPFYAIEPILKYKAFAESQFLNMTESVLQNDLIGLRHTYADEKGLGKKGFDLTDLQKSHANFAFHRELLESHARSLRDEIRSIDARGGLSWPRSKHETVESAALSLCDDYKWLEERAKELSALCDRAMTDIHDKSTLAEAVRGNTQAEDVNTLSKLATFMSVFYIPLSFTSGFFGMNFSAFGQGQLRLWLYPVVSVPILIASFVFMYFHLILGVGKDLSDSFHLQKFPMAYDSSSMA